MRRVSRAWSTRSCPRSWMCVTRSRRAVSCSPRRSCAGAIRRVRWPRRRTACVARSPSAGRNTSTWRARWQWPSRRKTARMLVHSSTQHPTEVQHAVAHALGIPFHRVTVMCRRMGGGFGGKESQPAQFACAAAILARRTRRPVKLRLDRDADMVMSGKRHDFLVEYDVGFDSQRAHPRPGADDRVALRLLGRLVRPGQRSRRMPRGQLLLPRASAAHVAPLQDQHRVQHRVPRLRRAAGHDGHRGGDRRHRASFADSIRWRSAAPTSTASPSATSPTTE